MTPYELASDYIHTNPQYFRRMVENRGLVQAAQDIVDDSHNDPQWAGRLDVLSVRVALVHELGMFTDEGDDDPTLPGLD